MRKLFLLIVLIIILVSLSWFHRTNAQDLTQLSDRQKAEMFRTFSATKAGASGTQTYRTPDIYDSTGRPLSTLVPNDGRSGDIVAVDTSTSNTMIAAEMPEFEQLRPFGQDLFGGPREAAPPDDIASSSDYILGPGDNIIISLWGRVEQEYNLTVDREGKVFIPKLGEVNVWGKRVDEFKSYARKKFSAVYSDFDMNVSLGKIRSIRIYLTGEVNRPGAYTVTSLTSLFNALYLAGGPNANGSMRAIRLMRGGKAVATLDLYAFLLAGDNTADIRLESGDAIFVPVAGARVAIRGQIHRPAIYELLGAETGADLLKLSGNATPQAHLDRVLLERVSDRGEWQVQDLNLNPDSAARISPTVLKDGDRLTVYSMFDAKTNVVFVSGMIKHPGCYERTDSTRVRDLLSRGQLQDYDVYYNRADLFRRHTDYRVEVIPINVGAVLAGDSANNIMLQDRDSLHVYSVKDVERDKYVYIGGEVARPGSYPLYDRMTAADLIFLSGSFTRGASRLQGELAHTDSLGQVTIDYIDLSDSTSTRIALREDDRLYVRTIPEWQLHRTVKVEGEVQFPGEYVLARRNETLGDLLQRCGGFTSNAFPPGAVFERRSIGRSLARLQIPKILENSRELVEDSAGHLEGTVLMTYDSSMVNRIVIDLKKGNNGRYAAGDLVLEPGDRVFVPPIPTGISVMGAVGATGTIKFTEHKKVKYYVQQAGDFTPRADKKGIRLIKANGAVLAGNEVLGRQAELGDIIVVPSKIDKERDWFKTMSTALAATTSLVTTVLLIDKL
ncbi:hypothetical protein C3F09_08945 [candidate division GN15 bacterium]|uniref:Polysaccharide export protein n=1 Tax=candidate division GN15 bacterium TaxID=2072418 RepID=A0A855X134_9BACT|nr:MAG: hypothetical protein C3F09_08945 [candidate division GN15 bacterium]